MTSGKTNRSERVSSATSPGEQKKAKPEWADGLREIYDSVLEEPLPDSFNDLLSKLDDDS